MNILILGRGWMGKKFHDYFLEQGDTSVLSPADITNAEEVSESIKETKPDAVLNCAGKKGTPNVDWCESHKEETFRSNTLGPLILRKVCEENKCYLVHISTGCIYDGDNNGKGWSEEDPPNYFRSYYSRTKAMAEDLLVGGNILQLRLRMPVTPIPEPGNLITKIVKYKTVISIPNSVSVVDDFIEAGVKLIRKKKTGIYNIVNPGGITHAEILDMYKEHVDSSFSYTIITKEQLAKITKADRCNCVLSTKKIEAEGIQMRPIREAMRDAMQKYAESVKLEMKPTA